MQHGRDTTDGPKIFFIFTKLQQRLRSYRKSFWCTPYDIQLFYDDKSICFSVQGQDYFDGGFIDFGGTEKLRRKIANNIETLLI